MQASINFDSFVDILDLNMENSTFSKVSVASSMSTTFVACVATTFLNVSLFQRERGNPQE